MACILSYLKVNRHVLYIIDMRLKNILFNTDINLDSSQEVISLNTNDEDADFIKNKKDFPQEIAILPLRNVVLFPGVIIPMTAGRKKSIDLLEHAYKEDKFIGVLAQKSYMVENPSEEDLYMMGTVAKILKFLKMPDGNTTVILQGKDRFKVNEFTKKNPFLKAHVHLVEEEKPEASDKEYIAMVESIKDVSINIIQESTNVPSEVNFTIRNIERPSLLINFISSNMSFSIEEKQALLEENNLKKRTLSLFKLLNREYEQVKLKNDIQLRVKNDIDQQQKEYFLHQQIKAIQEELGDVSYEKEIEEMKANAAKKKWPKEVKKQFDKELLKIQRINPQMLEYSIQRNYLELLLDLPWDKYSKDNFDLDRAEKILNRDHFGLEKPKERIIEHLAVLKLKGNMKSPIICLYGPPGVGKTSLGRSIASALNRKYTRMSLGGLHDESEIRGHRKTYIGAMSGRIIQSIRKAGTSNPVFVLDEIDKLGISAHGDPSAALLEVLDPEQNSSFYDNYLEIGYDLSKVLFIATANSLSNLSSALLDRMEIIELSGYTIEEKMNIAKRYLLPKQLKENGLKKSHLNLEDKNLEKLIEVYTHESGVRSLERRIAKLARFIAKKIATNSPYNKKISFKEIQKILGPAHEPDRYEGNDIIGVATGLAWTSVGGDILFIESSLSGGKGALTLTGNLGDVMKESATIARQYIKSHYEEFGIDMKKIQKNDLHIHVPEGAVPKDGPSAGIALLTSLVSIYTGRKIKPHLAMTGEITLRGKVLAVGGIKEKILAAKRANIKEIILSDQNKKDIEDIKEEYWKGLNFHYVKTMKEVISLALVQ